MYAAASQLRRGPHRQTNADWFDRMSSVKEPKRFLISQEKINTLEWESEWRMESERTNLIWTPPSARRVCIKFFLLINTQTSPSHAADSITSDSATSDLPAASRDSWRTPDVWLDVTPHLRHTYIQVHTHADKKHKSKQFHSAANVILSPRHLPRLHLPIVAVTPVHVNQRTHTVRIRDTDGGRAVLINHLPRPLYHSLWECDDQRETKEKIFLIKDLFVVCFGDWDVKPLFVITWKIPLNHSFKAEMACAFYYLWLCT